MTKNELSEVRNYVKKEMISGLDPQHGYDHLKRVEQNSLKIIKENELEDKLDVNLARAAALLHDIHYATHKPNIFWYIFESRLVKKSLPNVLDKLEIDENDKKVILTAAINHPHSFPFRQLNRDKDLYSMILQDADTMDMFGEDSIKTLKKSHKAFLHYRLLWYFGRWMHKWGQKNIGYFLNFKC